MEEKLSRVKDWSVEDRPREKLLLSGAKSLTNAELLAILMGSGTIGFSAVDLAKKIMADHHHNLHELGRSTIKELTKKYKGVGCAKAITIIAALELGKRRQSETAMERQMITSSKDVNDIMKPLIGDLSHEEFWIILLNRANKILGIKKISMGSQTATVVDVRQIIRYALENFAVGIILSHNHPSGVTKPSQEDKTLTDNIKKACKLMEINLFDHVIITEFQYFSFADEGLL